MKTSQLAAPFLSTILASQVVTAQSGAWQQCGGNNWTGAKTCVSGYTCEVINEWYHQCVPGSPNTAPATTKTTTKPSSTITTTTRPTGTVPPTTTQDTTTTTTGEAGGGDLPPFPSTLLPSHYFVRAVASPNFHSYLQAKPTRTPGTAYLDENTGAGQFRLESGQLVYNIGEGLEPLYMNVEKPDDLTQRKLTTSFKPTKNTFGTFKFQGDTLTWSTPEISRPNEAAWLVCEDQELFINTGAYLYQTPAGCFDQTIHSYGGSTPDV